MTPEGLRNIRTLEGLARRRESWQVNWPAEPALSSDIASLICLLLTAHLTIFIVSFVILVVIMFIISLVILVVTMFIIISGQ